MKHLSWSVGFLLFSLNAVSSDYVGEGYFGNANSSFACVDAALHALPQVLSERSSLDLGDYSIRGRARYESHTDRNGDSYTGTRCSVTFTPDGEPETFPENRNVSRDRDDRTSTITGEDATVEKACEKAESNILYWAQYGSGYHSRVFSSRLISRTYESGFVWGTHTPTATCTIVREFYNVLVSTSESSSVTKTGATRANACGEARSAFQAEAAAFCESRGLPLSGVWPRGESVEERRGNQVQCEISGSYSCFEQ